MQSKRQDTGGRLPVGRRAVKGRATPMPCGSDLSPFVRYPLLESEMLVERLP
jgi:hypothetical protein